MEPRAHDVKEWVDGAGRITVLTGAGISTDSGIPDYRGPDGVWTTNPSAQRMVTIADYLADPEVRVGAWQERLLHPAWTAEPGPGHRALVGLERTGRLRVIATQNIDGLHQAAGSDPRLVLELHGTLREAACLSCGRRTSMREALDRVEAGEPDPPCLACGGLQRSATIAFGQSLDPEVLAAATAAARDADLFMAVGTSLTVQPAANLCAVALDAGARLVIVNAQPTPYDTFAAAVLSAPIGEVLPALVGP
jgi:NAD-dependent deacetylase